MCVLHSDLLILIWGKTLPNTETFVSNPSYLPNYLYIDMQSARFVGSEFGECFEVILERFII